MTEKIQRKLSESKTARWTVLALVAFTMLCGYFITDKLLIESSGGVRYRWYVKASAGAWSAGGGISISFFPFSFMALVLPVSAYWGEKELDFSVGLGLRFTLGG